MPTTDRRQGDTARREREKQENSRTRQRAGQAVGLTKEEDSFNKHELEPSAIERNS